MVAQKTRNQLTFADKYERVHINKILYLRYEIDLTESIKSCIGNPISAVLSYIILTVSLYTVIKVGCISIRVIKETKFPVCREWSK